MEQRIAQAEPRNHPQPKVLRMAPVLRGLIWATIGFVVFDLFTVAVDPYRGNPLVTEPSAVIGWVGGLLGWLLGVACVSKEMHGWLHQLISHGHGIKTRNQKD